MNRIITVAVWCVLGYTGCAMADDFDAIKDKLSRQGCQYFEFVSVVHSDVFDDVDSAAGIAYLASDGRYNVKIAEDQYLCDGSYRYSYNVGSNQVIIEAASAESETGEEFYFIVRLDELYETRIVELNKRYRLSKRPDAGSEYPDSMDVEINALQHWLKQIEFYDVNEDLNVIRFLKQDYFEQTDAAWFEADFPDTVEKVKL